MLDFVEYERNIFPRMSPGMAPETISLACKFQILGSAFCLCGESLLNSSFVQIPSAPNLRHAEFELDEDYFGQPRGSQTLCNLKTSELLQSLSVRYDLDRYVHSNLVPTLLSHTMLKHITKLTLNSSGGRNTVWQADHTAAIESIQSLKKLRIGSMQFGVDTVLRPFVNLKR